MININIDKPQIPAGAGFTHLSTSWQISLTRDFNGALLSESIEDEVNLLEYRIANRLETNQIVFARVKIHFSNDTETNWSRIISISEQQKGFKLSNTIVVTPKLRLDQSVYDVTIEDVVVYGDDMVLYAGSGEHKYTDWKIEDTIGKVIWERLKDAENLTSIRLPSDILDDDKFYIVKAAYITDTNTSSNYGRMAMSTGAQPLQNISF